MQSPRPPHWLIYLSAVGALLYAAYGRREKVGAPPPPPPLPAAERALLAQASPLDPTRLVRVKRRFGDIRGAAFSVSDAGAWLTARRVTERCARPVILASDTEGLPARLAATAGETTVLATHGGAPALPLAAATPAAAAPAYDPGYPRGRPGELATRLLGRQTLRPRGWRQSPESALVWAELGRTEGLRGDLTGLFGAPALDSEGRVVGVVLGAAPRRGRVYTTAPAALARALAAANARPSPQAAGQPISPDDYGLAGDDLRRTLRIAPVVCLEG